MTAARPPLGFEAFGTAAGLALVVGALSIVAPSLTILVATLASLAVAGWASTVRTDGRYVELRGPRIVGLVSVGAGVVAYVGAPPGTVSFRGLALALGIAVLWLAERRRGADLRPGDRP